jgi:phosphatidyl-myo-inositol alpha-mannosyltransferase
MAAVRVGLVSPYSYTYPGGVGRHVEALAEELLSQGHEVRLLAPYDPHDRRARVMHRGVEPQQRPLPDYLVPLGRTVGFPMNGAVSNLATTPHTIATLSRELRNGDFDVVHVHEPNAPVVSWFAVEAARAPIVGTFHTYSTSQLANRVAANVIGARRLYNKLALRIAVSEAARWTAQRFYGGRYRIVPNGVDLSAARPGDRGGRDRLELLFVGRAEARKGLPVLLRAFEALRGAGVNARLRVAGATPEEVAPLLLDGEGVEAVGRIGDEEKWRLLGDADVVCAPSLGGESFGMVLTEALASGTPVVCSDIAGYRDVVCHEVDGLLVPAGRPVELGEALLELAIDPDRRRRMSEQASRSAERFAWPHVAKQVTAAFEQAAHVTAPEGRLARAALRSGLAQAEPGPRVRPRRLPSIEPAPPDGGRRRSRAARRVVMGAGAAAGVGLTALALNRIGIRSIVDALVAATPVWVLVASALMCLSLLIRAEAWHAILRAAMPGSRVRRRDAARATMVGVLMSATLPARLGEPSRALIMARRLGPMRSRFPLVLGTLVSQTLLNLLALSVLGIVMFSTVGLFHGHQGALFLATSAPVLGAALVVAAPWLLRSGKPSRFQRVQQAAALARRAMVQVRSGLKVFRRPRLGGWATLMQLTAWAVQWASCYALLVALGLDERAGIGAAAAVLFAVNVTAAVPATPSNLGVFQAACVAVLSAYGVGHTDALAYGIILQAVEIATAVAMGMPALLREGMTWRDLRMRALHAAPVQLRSAAEAEA